VSGATGGDAYAVIAWREQGLWQVDLLPEAVAENLDALLAAVRQQPGENGAFAMVDVAHEFFVVVRVQQGRIRVLLSDVTAADSWDLAGQVLDHLDLDVPDEDDLDVEPAGDLALFDDMGVGETEVETLLSDLDAYADEMLGSLARRLGFGEAYERVVAALVQ
jgi:putative tRNA adenosine deaminase-associated protein